MKKISVSMLFLVLFSSCKSKDCAVLNYELIDKFKKEIKIVKRVQQGRIVRTVKLVHAVLYLSKTTGIITQLELGDASSYRNKEECSQDIKAWENWLEQNRCLPKTN